MGAEKSLRAWIRQEPQPHHLRIHTVDDEVKDIQFTENLRNRWKAAEEAIRALKAVTVECVNKDGDVLRAREIAYYDDEDTGGKTVSDRADEARRNMNRAVVEDRREMANMFDRYGDKLCEAFERGAAASASNQENMVSLVEVLTTHLGIAITNLHNVSVNLANVHAQREGVEDPGIGGNADLIKQLLGAAALKAVGSGTMGGPVKPPAPNGGVKP